jgi:hypothetical protein
VPAVTTTYFRKLWAELHNRAARGAYFVPSDKPQPGTERLYLASFERRIRCSGCRRHWRAVVAKLPPDFSSRAAYFRWTVRAHNQINKRLDKPAVTIRRARSLWNFDTFHPAR